MTARARVPFRVHGPFRHRTRWRLDVFDNGRRYKRSFATYDEAIRAAHDLTAGHSPGHNSPAQPTSDPADVNSSSCAKRDSNPHGVTH